MRLDEDARILWVSKNILPHENAIRHIIRSWRLPHDIEPDDILQEAYAKITDITDLGHIVAPKAYFVQVARSVLLMHIRRSKLVPIDMIADLDNFDAIDDAPTSETQVSDREQLRLLARAVKKTYGPPRLQVGFYGVLISLRQRMRSHGSIPWPRWTSARLEPQ